MTTATMAFLAVTLMIIAFWQKKLWIYFLDALFWAIFGIWEMTTYTYGSVNFYAGFACIGVAIIMFMAAIWARPKREAAPLEPSKRALYEERLNRELDSVKKKRED